MKRFKKILCLVEPEANSQAALAQAIKIANDHQASVTVAAVLKISGAMKNFFKSKDEINNFLRQSSDFKRSETENWVRKFESKLNVEIEIFSGLGFIEIVQSVIKNQYDLVIKCADDVDWMVRLFGSDDMHLLRKCPCPVLMLKPGKNDVFRNVLATVDVNDGLNELDENRVQDQLNKAVLEYCATFSLSQLTDLHIGSAWEVYGESFLRYGAFSNMSEEEVNLYTEQIQRECSDRLELLVREMKCLVGKDTVNYLRPKVHFVKGLPSKEIPLMVKKHNIDLVVMGTVARTGIPGLIIGNTAESILEQIQCSVLAIKPPGFKTPIQP